MFAIFAIFASMKNKTTTIYIEEKTVYGRPTYYVVGEHAAAIERLTGKKTVSLADMRALRSLGLGVEAMIWPGVRPSTDLVIATQ